MFNDVEINRHYNSVNITFYVDTLTSTFSFLYGNPFISIKYTRSPTITDRIMKVV